MQRVATSSEKSGQIKNGGSLTTLNDVERSKTSLTEASSFPAATFLSSKQNWLPIMNNSKTTKAD